MNIRSTIEHTLLKPQATAPDVEKLCREAIDNSFAGVCVSPAYVEKSAKSLQGSGVQCVSVVGFSSGAFLTESKVDETHRLVDLGADEIDMVMAIWALKNRDEQKVIDDIKKVKTSLIQKNQNGILKVIIETALLSDDEKKLACECCLKAGADYIKTSTGAFSGATIEDIKLIKSCVGEQAKIKASGGIRDLEFARQLLEAGATRLGTSAGIQMVMSESSKA